MSVMKINFFLRLCLSGTLFTLLSAERCVEITDIAAPVNVSPGNSFTVKTRLKNLTDGADAFALNYYLSYDRLYNPEDLLLNSKALTGFPANTAKQVSLDLNIPAGTFNGRYYLIAKAQDGEMYRDIHVNGPVNIGADLVPANLFIYGSDKPDEEFRFAFSLLNRGMLPASFCKVRGYLSTDTYIDANDRKVYEVSVSSPMAGNEIREYTGVSYPIPTDMPPGDYYFVLAADVNNDVAETVEINNYVSKLITIKSAVAGAPVVEERGAAAGYTADAAMPGIAVAPNPATDFIDIAWQLPTTAPVRLDVLSLSGQVLESFAERVMDAGTYSQRIELAEWPAGIYLVRVQTGGLQVVKKVVKQ